MSQKLWFDASPMIEAYEIDDDGKLKGSVFINEDSKKIKDGKVIKQRPDPFLRSPKWDRKIGKWMEV